VIRLHLLLLLAVALFCVDEASAKSGGWGRFPTRQQMLAPQTPSPAPAPTTAPSRESSTKLSPPVAPGMEKSESTIRNPDLPADVTIEKNSPAKSTGAESKEDLTRQTSDVAETARKARIKAERERLNHNAFVWQEQRAAAGSATAQRSLAMRYLTGDGVQKDEPKGMDLLRKAATGGDSAAQKELAKREPAKKE
jgi:hypothetical protein